LKIILEHKANVGSFRVGQLTAMNTAVNKYNSTSATVDMFE